MAKKGGGGANPYVGNGNTPVKAPHIKGGGGANPYVGNGNTPVKAPHIKGGGTESVKIITPKGK